MPHYNKQSNFSKLSVILLLCSIQDPTYGIVQSFTVHVNLSIALLYPMELLHHLHQDIQAKILF